MLEIFPAYYENFRCIADRCEDTCCAGWEIDIDDASYEAYMRVGGDLGARLRACIKTYGEMKDGDGEYEEVYEQHGFVLTEDMRCPFLDEHNLCDLYKELGEEALCEVCTNTPRNYLEYACGDEMIREISISASCPEAARLLYASEEPMRFTEKNLPDGEASLFAGMEEKDIDDDERELGVFLKNVRDVAMRILQDRSKDLHERIKIFLRHSESVQEVINRWEAGEDELPDDAMVDEFEMKESPDVMSEDQQKGDRDIRAYRHFLIRMGTYSGLASIGPAWAERMELLMKSFVGDEEEGEIDGVAVSENNRFRDIYAKTSDNLMKHLIKNGRMYDYEHLLVYYAFLLLNRSIDDYDYLGKAKLVVLSYLMNRDMDAAVILNKKAFEKSDREENARIYAREVEHAEENLADIFEEILFERAYDTDSLIEVL